jgi:hypothetical protein
MRVLSNSPPIGDRDILGEVWDAWGVIRLRVVVRGVSPLIVRVLDVAPSVTWCLAEAFESCLGWSDTFLMIEFQPSIVPFDAPVVCQVFPGGVMRTYHPQLRPRTLRRTTRTLQRHRQRIPHRRSMIEFPRFSKSKEIVLDCATRPVITVIV